MKRRYGSFFLFYFMKTSLLQKLKITKNGFGLQSVISEFAEVSGVTISRKWEPRVTHIIASINDNGACKRTLKFMMGVLEGKWILSIDCKYYHSIRKETCMFEI